MGVFRFLRLNMSSTEDDPSHFSPSLSASLGVRLRYSLLFFTDLALFCTMVSLFSIPPSFFPPRIFSARESVFLRCA